jgi:hypothetical protein
MKKDAFVANKILMKCPSMYNDGKEGLKEFKSEAGPTTAL